MKLTKSKLQRIIREEYSKALHESEEEQRYCCFDGKPFKIYDLGKDYMLLSCSESSCMPLGKMSKEEFKRKNFRKIENPPEALFEDGRPCAKRSDGCTNFPDGNILMGTGKEWRHCCVDHDCCYVRGGDESDRLKCDEELRNCVNKVGGPGDLMFAGVQEFGKDNFNTREKVAEGWLFKKEDIQRMIKEEALKVIS